jgi:hypothetical protein
VGPLKAKYYYLGEWRILRKLSDGTGECWRCEIQYNKKRYKRKLLPDLEVSVMRAKELIDAARTGNIAVLEGTKHRHQSVPVEPAPAKPVAGIATIGQILEKYEEAKDLEAADKVRVANGQALRNAIRRSLGMPLPAKTATFAERAQLNAEINEMSSAIFTERLARDYWRAVRVEVNACKDDQAAAQRVRISRTSLLMQGISVFRPRCILRYRDAGLVLPSTLVEFMAGCKAEKPQGLAARYNPPAEKVIQAALHDWLKIKDRNLFLAVGLELCFGLRLGEVTRSPGGC